MHKHNFFSNLSDSWDKQHASQEELNRTREFAKHFKLQPGEYVLDVGCGSGRLIPVISKTIGRQGKLVELDFAAGMLTIARQKCRAANVTFVLADAHALPLPDKDFDKVIALALFPHLDDKVGALREFYRVLKPGGALIIAHQMGQEALNRFHGQSGDPVSRDMLPNHLVMEKLLAQAGFSGIKIHDDPDQYIAWAQV